MGCRNESYFLEFMYVDVARDFVGVVLRVLLDGATGTVVVLSPHVRSTSISSIW